MPKLLRNRRRIAVLLLLMFALGCGDDMAMGGDGGVAVHRDGAVFSDAGVTSDGAVLSDGGAAPEDGGTTVDGGPAPAGIECTEMDILGGTRTTPMCRTTVEGLEVGFVPLPDDVPVEHLAFYFHGDGGGVGTLGGLRRQAAWGRKHNTMVVAVKSPVSDSDRTDIDFNNLVGPRWWLVEAEHVQQLGRAMDRFVAHYGVDPHEMLFESASGGSQFVNKYLIPHLGNRFSGVYAIHCGGSRPPHESQWLWDPSEDTESRDRIFMRFQYGTEDFLAPQIERGIPQWEELGFDVQAEVAEGEHHCGGDRRGHVLSVWSEFLGVEYVRE